MVNSSVGLSEQPVVTSYLFSEESLLEFVLEIKCWRVLVRMTLSDLKDFRIVLVLVGLKRPEQVVREFAAPSMRQVS